MKLNIYMVGELISTYEQKGFYSFDANNIEMYIHEPPFADARITPRYYQYSYKTIELSEIIKTARDNTFAKLLGRQLSKLFVNSKKKLFLEENDAYKYCNSLRSDINQKAAVIFKINIDLEIRTSKRYKFSSCFLPYEKNFVHINSGKIISAKLKNKSYKNINKDLLLKSLSCKQVDEKLLEVLKNEQTLFWFNYYFFKDLIPCLNKDIVSVINEYLSTSLNLQYSEDKMRFAIH